MESSQADNKSASPQYQDDVVDSLVEQLSGVMRLSARPIAARQQRARRFSDAGGAPTAGPSTKSEPFSVRSKDGSRWLPAPDEVTHSVGIKRAGTVNSSPTVRTVAESMPLQPHECRSAVCAIVKVFETTELLEIILGCLQPRDVLALRPVCSKWDSIIQRSPRLHLNLFVHPEFSRPTANLKLLPLSMSGLSIEFGPSLHLGRWIHVTINAEAAAKIVPNRKPSKRVRSRSIFEGMRGGLGPKSVYDPWPATKATQAVSDPGKYEDLFITQPPLVGMQAFVLISNPSVGRANSTEGNVNDTVPTACAKLSRDAGITLGFLAETAQSLLASTKDAGEDARVLFKAIMSFYTSEKAPRQRGIASSVTMIG